MLRNIFVFGILGIGLFYAVQGPFYGLLLYLWIAYFRPEQWVWGDFVSRLNLSFVIGVSTLIALLFSRERLRFNLRIGLLGLFLLHALISTALATHPEIAWPWWIEISKWLLITYVMVVVATDVTRFRVILLVIALSLGFEAAKQGWASLILHPGAPNENELPMLGDNNGVAVGMLMLAPILTMLGATASSKRERWLHRFLAVGVVNRALTTYSRGGFLACIALVLMYVLRSPRRVPALAGILLAAAIVLPVLPQAFWDRMNTIKTPDQIRQSTASAEKGEAEANEAAANDSSLGRLHFWSVAVTMANDRPFVGVGLNAFNENYDKFDDSRGEYGSGRSVHSAWFGVLAELGYPGLLLFLAQIILAFSACRRARRAARLWPEHAILRQFAFALEAGLVVFAVGGSFLPYQYQEMLWHWFGLTIALDRLARAAAPAQSSAAGAATLASNWKTSRVRGLSAAGTLAS